ncbi:MAG TPA: hypothetical protein VM509_11500 [Planctomycetota bacterium]|nr:hypothetical protein [Planctomycetota bacterium]
MSRATLQRSLERLAARKPAAVVGPRDEPALAECALRLGCKVRIDPELAPQSDTGLRTSTLCDALGALSRECPGAEVVILLDAAEIQLALSRALLAPDARVFAPEPGQTVALDWPHPEAREFRHGLVGVGFDWDVSPVAKQMLRFPGGASVLPRG